MADEVGWIDASAGAPSYTGAKLRRLHAALTQYNGRTLGGKLGVRPGGTALETSIAGSVITVRGGPGIADPAWTTADGPYWFALPADETFTLGAAHASLTRQDVTVLRIGDSPNDGGSGLRLARSEYVQNPSAGTGADPAVLPTGSFKIGRIVVPPSGGGSPTVTQLFPFTVAAGGICPVRDQAERDAISSFDGFAVYRRDRDWVEIHDGTAWRVQGVAVASSASDRDTAITSPYNGQLAMTTDTGLLWQRIAGAWREAAYVPFTHAYAVAEQTLLNGTLHAVLFGAELADLGGAHSIASNTSRFLPTTAGRYEFQGLTTVYATVASLLLAQFRKNGAAVAGASPYRMNNTPSQGTVANSVSSYGEFDLNGTTDYVELYTMQVSGGSVQTFANIAGDQTSMVTMKRIGPI